MNRRVFVTGGASGIGRGVVEYFVAEGATVAFCDVDSVAGAALESSCGAKFYPLDVCDAALLEGALAEFDKQSGGIDIIINNVGISRFTPLTEISIEEYDTVLATNLRPAFITSRYLARARNSEQGRKRYGRIINIASTRYLQSEPHSEAYASSKGGIVSLTHALSISLADYNITVNCISPGWIDTGHYPISEEDNRLHPSARVGTVGDVARVCGFLCDERNDFVNGENITLDGGVTRKMVY